MENPEDQQHYEEQVEGELSLILISRECWKEMIDSIRDFPSKKINSKLKLTRVK